MKTVGIITNGDGEFRKFMLGKYADCVKACGGDCVILPWDMTASTELAERCGGFLFTGGGDIDPKYYGEETLPQTENVIPERDEFELSFLRSVLETKKPVLGVCRGLQLINVALGGTLYQDYPTQRPDVPYSETPREKYPEPSHSVIVEYGSMLHGLTGMTMLQVNSLHHQAIKDPAPGLAVTARTPEGLIEAVELPSHPYFLCVQWHPEHMFEHDEPSQKIFHSFVGACK